MSKIWVVVADEAKVRIFSAEKPKGTLTEIKEMTSSEATMLEQDLVSDKPGRGESNSGARKHAFEEKTSHKAQYAIRFSKEVSEYLEASLQSKSFGRLTLVAAPHFLGMLRKDLSAAIDEVVSFQLDKDLTMMTPQEIREHLPEYL
ncbi:host attachment protein [Leucothrix arctica]|nr:host attachment protein [Leucothrix arctica]